MIHFTIDQFWRYVAPVIGFGIGKLVDHFLRLRRIKIFQKKDPVAESVKNNILIEHKIEEIRTQFHNGGNFYPTGKSIPKFSIFYENLSAGTPMLREKYQNIPVSIFGKFFNYLSENHFSFYMDIKNVDEDFDEKGFSKDSDAKSSYCSSMRSVDNKFMGVLVVQYIKKKKILTETLIKDIEIAASSIGSSLSTHQENPK